MVEIKLLNSMEQSPEEVNSCSLCQILRLICSSRAHCHVHKDPPLDAILSQLNPFYSLRPYFFNIHSGLVLQVVACFIQDFR